MNFMFWGTIYLHNYIYLLTFNEGKLLVHVNYMIFINIAYYALRCDICGCLRYLALDEAAQDLNFEFRTLFRYERFDLLIRFVSTRMNKTKRVK